MDFLLIVLGIGGLVVAGAMLVLASRVSRMQRESDARVDKLQALAIGSVLFTDQPFESSGEVVEARNESPQSAPSRVFEMPADAYPFVITVPAGAGRRVAGSFDRISHRSRT